MIIKGCLVLTGEQDLLLLPVWGFNRCLHLYSLPEGRTIAKQNQFSKIKPNVSFNTKKQMYGVSLYRQICISDAFFARRAFRQMCGPLPQMEKGCEIPQLWGRLLIILPFRVITACKEYTQRALGCHLCTSIYLCTTTNLCSIAVFYEVICYSYKDTTYLPGIWWTSLDLSVNCRLLSSFMSRN